MSVFCKPDMQSLAPDLVFQTDSCEATPSGCQQLPDVSCCDQTLVRFGTVGILRPKPMACSMSAVMHAWLLMPAADVR